MIAGLLQAVEHLLDRLEAAFRIEQPFRFQRARDLAHERTAAAGGVGERRQDPNGRRVERQDSEQLNAVAGPALQKERLGEATLGRIDAFDFADFLDEKPQRHVDHRAVKSRAAHARRERDVADFAQQPAGNGGHGAHYAFRQGEDITGGGPHRLSIESPIGPPLAQMDRVATQSPVTPANDLDAQFQRLLDFEPTTLPVISLYLNTQPDNHGRDSFEGFIQRQFASRARTFAAGSPELESFSRDTARIQQYLEKELKPSANGLALFACSGADEFFEAVQLGAPVDEHRLYVYNQPHLYHLARLDDEYPRYAALVTDANSARIFVFGLGEKVADAKVKGKKVQRVKVGGWSQARYQRRVGNAHKEHAKESIDALERIVREQRLTEERRARARRADDEDEPVVARTGPGVAPAATPREHAGGRGAVERGGCE